MQHITLIRWLEDVVEGLGGTTTVVQIEVVRESDFKRVHISFQVSFRHIDFASMEPVEPTRWFRLPQWVEWHQFG